MKTLPPLPASVWSALGPIPVEVVSDLKAKDGDDCLGLWLPEIRTIRVCAELSPITAWVTLRHEHIHAIMWDSGCGLTSKEDERVADALATARVAEMLAE